MTTPRTNHEGRKHTKTHEDSLVQSFLRVGFVAFVISWLVLVALQVSGTGQRAQQPAPEAPMPAVLKNYQPVTAERLLKPEDSNWLMVRRTYDGWGYSPLDQITTKNVEKLLPVWEFSTGVVSGHEAP